VAGGRPARDPDGTFDSGINNRQGDKNVDEQAGQVRVQPWLQQWTAEQQHVMQALDQRKRPGESVAVQYR
jgi:hypothetical protein